MTTLDTLWKGIVAPVLAHDGVIAPAEYKALRKDLLATIEKQGITLASAEQFVAERKARIAKKGL
jgi:hypothetical protein